MSIASYYWRCGQTVLNFGEHFAEMIPEMMGCPISPYYRGHHTSKLLMTVGSCFVTPIINDVLKDCDELHIWGTGNGMGREHCFAVNGNPRIHIHACRGNLTRMWNNCGPVPVGDPVFCLPHLLPLEWKEGEQILYAPHWENRRKIESRMYNMGATEYFDVFIHKNNIHWEMERLLSAKFVLTNALHVTIFCLAYGIPFANVMMPGETLNFQHKWQDTFHWLGTTPQFVQSYSAGVAWWKKTGSRIVIPSMKPVISAFPFSLKML